MHDRQLLDAPPQERPLCSLVAGNDQEAENVHLHSTLLAWSSRVNPTILACGLRQQDAGGLAALHGSPCAQSRLLQQRPPLCCTRARAHCAHIEKSRLRLVVRIMHLKPPLAHEHPAPKMRI